VPSPGPAGLQPDQQLAPASGALTGAGLEADQLLLALGRGADDHRHALGLRLHPRLQVDAVGPDVDVAPGRQVASLPALVLAPPVALEPGDHRGRQVGRLLAEKGGERLLEVAGRDPAQVEHRPQRIEAPGPPRPARQDPRGEADALLALGRGTVADLHPLHHDRADPGLEGTFRAMAVPDEPGAAVGEPPIGHPGQEGLGLRLDGSGEQAARSRAQRLAQRVIDHLGLRETDDGAILIHGVSLSWRGPGRLVARLDTPPSSDRRHPASAIAHQLDGTAGRPVQLDRFRGLQQN
jgi:hypothetical protein